MELVDDLAAEHAALDAVVAPLDAEAWDAPTPAAGWTIRHQVAHLAYFDEQGAIAATDPDRFDANPVGLDTRGTYWEVPADELLVLWRRFRVALLDAFAGVDPKARLPWYGPTMSARSFLTARLMETWAHGVDVTDALGLPPSASERLRHVAHLGVATRGWSYAVRGQEPPGVDVFVSLRSPMGEQWTWGDADAADRVTGDALDFCLVVTQRRPVGETGLRAEGAAAEGWLAVAQIFAGDATTTTRAST
jgi:uncharacterized protein (TIGR03084 family)